jgi:hypothetical protein
MSSNISGKMDYEAVLSECTYASEHIFPSTSKKFEDTKGVIRIRNSKKGRQHNGQKKKTKGQTTI